MNNNLFGAQAGNVGPLPLTAAVSGAYYTLFGMPTTGGPATVAPVANQVVYTPIYVPFSISVSKIAALASGGTISSGLIRYALYTMGTNGLPGTLIYDFGANFSTTLLSAAAGSPPALTKGWCFLAMNSSSTSISYYGYSPSAVCSFAYSGLVQCTSSYVITSAPATLNAASQTFGAFPTTPSVPNTSFANFPIGLFLAA